MKLYKKTLDNGMTIALVPMTNVATVTAGFFVKAGGRNETDENNGIAHFLEHMMFKGTKTRSSKDVLYQISMLGLNYNAYTTNEETVYFMSGDPNDTKKILDLVLDIYINPVLTTKDIEVEKKVIIEERRMRYDAPYAKIWRAMYKKFFNGTGLERDLLGSEDNILSFNRANFVDFRKTYYQPSNCIFVVAGNFNHNLISKLVSKPLSKVKNCECEQITYEHEKKIILENMAKQDQPYVNIKKNMTYQQIYFVMAFELGELYDDYGVEIDVLTDILARSSSSRLNNALRERQGITYGSGSGVLSYSDCAVLYINFALHPNQLETAIKTTLSELRKLKSQLVTDDELKMTISHRKNDVLFSNESSYGTFSAVGNALLKDRDEKIIFAKKESYAKKMIAELKAIKAKKIQDLAKKIFIREKINIFMYGNVAQTKFDYIDL